MLEKFTQVNNDLRTELDGLIEACAPADGFVTELYTEASLNVHRGMDCAFTVRENGRLAGFLFVFAPTATEVEINALVHPLFRGKGHFKAMLAAALESCGTFGYRRGYLFCNGESAAVAILDKWGLRLSHVEYQMEKTLRAPAPEIARPVRLTPLTLEDVPAVGLQMAQCFGKDREQQEAYLRNSIGTEGRTNWVLKDGEGRVIGFTGSSREGNALGIFGLGVVPKFRGQGYGRVLLDLLSAAAMEHGVETLKLDVNSANTVAIGLYTSYGFIRKSATRYYEIDFGPGSPPESTLQSGN